MLYENFGWRGIFFVMSGIILVIFILVLVYIKLIILELDKEGFNKDFKYDKKFWDILILKYKKFIICIILVIIIYFGYYILMVYMVRMFLLLY